MIKYKNYPKISKMPSLNTSELSKKVCKMLNKLSWIVYHPTIR